MEWGCHNLAPEKGVVGPDTPVNKNKVVQHLKYKSYICFAGNLTVELVPWDFCFPNPIQ